MKRLVIPMILGLFIAFPALADRVALVLGNGNYEHSTPLRNAANDANDMADKLRGLGFRVFQGIDLERRETLLLVQDFVDSLKKTDTALFFYAGHASQIGAENYVMPVDVQPANENDLVESSIKMQSILASMEHRAGTWIVILDACRNNPFVRSGASRSADASRGLFRMDAGVGSYIAYSTEPGNVAADGTGRNSPFTSALLKHITDPNKDIHSMMRSVRADVVNASNRRQTPWENSALIDAVFLAGTKPSVQQNSQSGPNGNQIAALQAPLAAVPPPPAFTRTRSANEVCTAIDAFGTGAAFCTSSVLKSQSGNTYGGMNLFDNDLRTAWVEGKEDEGLGEYIDIEFDDARDVRAVSLINGYTKSERTFSRNARVKTVRILASNGKEAGGILQDSGTDWQQIHLVGFNDISWIRIEITNVFSGTHYKDTAISELRLQ